MSRNIVLIGMPGCGKSTLCRIVSEKLSRCAIDLDDYIEANEKKSIKEMFAVSERLFRDAETKYSILAGELNSYIIATGGGIVKREENINNLKKNSVIIFINRPIEDIIKDIDVKTRPLLSDGTADIYKLYNDRIHLYKKSCDIEIINVGKIEEVADLIIKSVNIWKGRIIMEEKNRALKKHMEWKGKLEVVTKAKIDSMEDLAIAYTPGVAEPCLEIARDESLAYEYTGKGNLVAVITDGTAVLGLGDIGPSAGMPVMEGKCALFKRFAGIDAIPICVDSKDPEVIINTVRNISKSFGGINLEDISAPRCFEIERALAEQCDIPVFHDDQHGTAIVTTAAIINSLKVTGRKPGNLKIVISGAGAAGISIARLLVQMDMGDIILCGSKGTIYEGAPGNNSEKEQMAKITNKGCVKGSLSDAMKGADIFIGVSKPGIVTKEMIKSMAENPIVFAMANPVPEIMPNEATEAGAAVAGTGRSDFPNQVNNVLVFPGFFKGLLRVRAVKVVDSMKIQAAMAIAGIIDEKELKNTYVLPEVFDERVADAVANAVAEEAVRLGINRK